MEISIGFIGSSYLNKDSNQYKVQIYLLYDWPIFFVNNSLTKPKRKFLQRKIA